MLTRRLHREPLELWLLVSHDEIGVVARAETMISDLQQ